MTAKTVRITYAGDAVTMTCDLSDASAPIVVDGSATQYQTADARHRTHLAVALAASVAWPDAEWPAVTGDHAIDDDATEAWADLEYETVAEITDAQIRAIRAESAFGCHPIDDDAQIEALRTESAEAGDLALVAICDIALIADGDPAPAYRCRNSWGRAGGVWDAIYATQDDAAEAIRRAMGWDDVVLSDSFSTDDGDAVCAYPSQDECDADEEGAHAIRIVEVDAAKARAEARAVCADTIAEARAASVARAYR